MKYLEYIKSPKWRKIKHQAIINARGKCVLCGSRGNLVVHHTKYPKNLGDETVDMLQCLCETCHNVKCHNGSASNSKIRLTKEEKKRRKKSRKKAKFAGPIKIYTEQEIAKYIDQHPGVYI